MIVYPWHHSQWQKLVQAPALHHGLMFTGLPGIGKLSFSLALAKRLLCDELGAPDNQSCGNCHSCRLFEAGTHPDFHLLTTEFESVENDIQLISAYSDRYQDAQARAKKAKPGKVISIDQVRSLIERFSTHAHISTRKVALISPAHSMNINASNALLKLLEEPPQDSILILLTDAPGFLPATIRSRCVLQKLRTPSQKESQRWLSQWISSDQIDLALKMANGGPLLAKQQHDTGALIQYATMIEKIDGLLNKREDPVALAAQINKTDFQSFLGWFQRYVGDIIRLRVHGAPVRGLKIASGSIERFSIQRLYALYDKICFYKRIANDSINEQLAIEEMLILTYAIAK